MAAALPSIAVEKEQRDLVKELATAVSTQAEVANRMWLALITVAILALMPHVPTKSGTVNLPFNLGEASPLWFSWILFSILVGLAIAFAAAHAQQIRAHQLAQSVIARTPAALTIGILHPRDYFDMLRKPSVTRVASLAQVLRGRYQFYSSNKGLPSWLRRITTFYYMLLKLVSMIIYFCLPICALVFAWNRVSATGAPLWWCKTTGLTVAALALGEVFVFDVIYAFAILKVLWRVPPKEEAN